MNPHKTRALYRLLGLGGLLGALLLLTPAPAQACAGGGGYYECRSFWLDEVFYPCLAYECAGLSGQAYHACRSACWQAWKDASAECNDCPY